MAWTRKEVSRNWTAAKGRNLEREPQGTRSKGRLEKRLVDEVRRIVAKDGLTEGDSRDRDM